MPSPRDVLLSAMADCLKRIKKADGYNTNAGLKVTREPAPKLAHDDEFLTVVWSAQARPQDPAASTTKRLTTVDVVAKVPAALPKAQETLDEIVSDIELAMADQSFRYPAGYQVPQYQGAAPLRDGPAAGWVAVAITYTSHIPIR
jgi:hypothetical protein